MIKLYDHQLEAVNKLKNGAVLCGGVGSGKSLTALAYYYLQEGGKINKKTYIPMKKPKDLYIITTALKRDTLEWEGELVNFLMSTNKEVSYYDNNIIVDSWNKIKDYSKVYGAFFIFDEQRLVGNGPWVKAFLKIAKRNKWILLSATPGDTWNDYIPLFIANGFYKSRSEFTSKHAVYSRYTKYPKVERYIDTEILFSYRNKLLVDMDFDRNTISHHENMLVDYDMKLYKETNKNRWNIFKKEPIKTAGELCYTLRKIVNSDESRELAILGLVEDHPKTIIFYNFDYELNILKNLGYGEDVTIAEWNGHKHEPLPKTDKWVYLVQYTSGSEGWNCTETDTIIFYSQNYSYKVMVQAAGRIDRLNTPFKDLYYYHLKSRAGIDLAIAKAIKNKKTFSESRYVNRYAK